MKKSPERSETIRRLKSTFVFGTQYFRPPTPRPDEWERDLDKIQSLGMDHIRLWALWCAIEPRPGELRFERYDKLMEMAGERDLGVQINFILDHVPVWAGRKNNGYLIKSDGTPDRKDLLFGGHFACWDNPGMRADAEPFIRATVERYRELPQMLIWDVWNEVKYYWCWCPHSAAAFSTYMMERFGSLDRINEECGTAYGDPSEIELPYNGRDICLSLVGHEFSRARLNQQMAWVRDIIRGADDVTPIMTHSHSWGSTTKGIPMWDDWTVRNEVDLWGASQHIIYYQNQHAARNRFAYTIANLESKRASGHYWLSEMTTGMMRGGLGGMRNRVAEGDLTFNMWTFFAHGAKGFTYWQFHPERYSAEAPGWGLVAMDGSDTYHTEEARRFKGVLDEHRDFMENAAPPAEDVGVLYDPQSSVLHAIMQRSDYTRCFHGIIYALWLSSVRFRILRDWDDFSKYKTIIVPGALCLKDEAMEKLLAFAEGGGKVVVDGGFASYAPNGFYRTHTPGDALHERFGYKEVDILPLYDKEVSVELETTGLEVEGLPVHVDMTLPNVILRASYDYRRLVPLEGTDVVGTYPDGSPAVLRRKIGEGEVIAFGSVIGPDLLEGENAVRRHGLIDFLGLEKDIPFTAKGNVTASLMDSGDERWVLLFNHDNTPSTAQLDASIGTEPVFASSADLPATEFEAKGVKVFRVTGSE